MNTENMKYSYSDIPQKKKKGTPVARLCGELKTCHCLDISPTDDNNR